MFASESTAIPSIILGQSDSPKLPVFILLNSTLDCAESIRWTSCSFDISRLNTATDASPFKAAFWTRFKENAVLPMAGLAANSIKSVLCKPLIFLFKSAKPVVIPVTSLLSVHSFSIISNVSCKTTFIGWISSPDFSWDISNIFFSALSNISWTSVDASYPKFIISLEALISCLITDFSFTMFA